MTAKEQMIAGLPFDTHDETLAYFAKAQRNHHGR